MILFQKQNRRPYRQHKSILMKQERGHIGKIHKGNHIIGGDRSQSPQRTIISEKIPHAFMFSVIIWTGQQAGTRCPKSFLLLIAGD